MAVSQERFQTDCVSWDGYKPCEIQEAEGRSDCFGCNQYEPGSIQLDTDGHTPFNAEMLTVAREVGVIEMGGLGSVLRTTAVTRAIRDVNPGASITWFTHQRGVELLKYVPGVTPVNLGIESAAEHREKIQQLDVLLNFELNQIAKEIVPYARCIGGFAINAQGKFYGANPDAEYMQRMQIDNMFRKYNKLTMQEVLLRSVGLEGNIPQYDVELQPANYARANTVLAEAFAIRRPEIIIGLNIGTSEKGKLQRWPTERYAALSSQLAAAYSDLGVAILSGPQDDEIRQRVIESLGEHQTNLAVLPNNIEVGDFLALLSRLRLVVTADSFALHAARSQDVRIVALTGPMPHRELELVPTDSLIGPLLDCSPCFLHCSQPLAGQCMQDIGVQHVFDEISNALRGDAADAILFDRA